MTASVTVIGNPVSPYVRKVLAVSMMKGIEVRIDPITPFRGDDAFSALSPLRRIPVWIEGDLTLCDSSIIVQYLEETRPSSPLWPSNPVQRAHARWIEEFADTRLFDVLGWKLFFQMAVKPRTLKEPPERALIEKARDEEAPELFDYLESQIPAEGFLFGDVSIADFSLAPAFLNAQVVGVTPSPDRWPRLVAWLARMEAETVLGPLNDLSRAFMTTPFAQHRDLLATHGWAATEVSHDAGFARRGPMSPV